MSEFGLQIVFKELFDRRHQRVVVPMIQRDYAQGRDSAKEVRDEFLDTLFAALQLPEDDPTLPLNLDFIYGSMEKGPVAHFLPLDGQQRLTTLFLLHWYLAWRDECLDEFKELFCEAGASRFSYSVRPSSKEFFDALVGYKPGMVVEEVITPSVLLTDQPWYYRYWRLDPTIQAALNMLDAIHLRFKDSKGLFGRITETTHPAITFRLLDLENFGLTDDLYIKMNARGKPLTPFETFKARFEQILKELFGEETRKFGTQTLTIAEFFSHRMDTKWADFFWPYQEPGSGVFDTAVMNLFRAVILLTRLPESQSYATDIDLLRSPGIPNTFSLFSQRGWLDRAFAEMLILLLDLWSQDGKKLNNLLPDSRYFNEVTFFTKAARNPTSLEFDEIVQFTGYVLYIRQNAESIDPVKFQEWMRIVFNLAVNTEYHRSSDVQRSISSLVNLLPYSEHILVHLQSPEKKVAGFSSQQIAEEKLKAQLLLGHSGWKPLIDQAEGHGYFRGQIEFLLDFCGAIAEAAKVDVTDWDDDTHQRLHEKYKEVLPKAFLSFGIRGLNVIAEYKWERALLSIGNYLLPSSSNLSFLIDSPSESTSWKRLLRGNGASVPQTRRFLGELWQRLRGTDDLVAQLDDIIRESDNLEPWRESFVRTPAAISYCSRRQIRFTSADEVYLLQTTRMSGRHAELFTYCLYENSLRKLHEDGSLKPLNLSIYDSRTGIEYRPGVELTFSYCGVILYFWVEYSQGKFKVFILQNAVQPIGLLKTALLDGLGFISRDSIYVVESNSDGIVECILNLAKKLGNI